MSIPVTFAKEEPVQFISFNGLTFEGNFVAHSKVVVGKIVGAGAVRALCLSFDDVTLLPYFGNIPKDHLLHVPVLAVDSMADSAA